MGASYMVTREMRVCDKELLNEDIRQHFIVGDNNSLVIKGTINVLNFITRGMGMVFRMWAHKGAPLNSQWPVLANGGTDLHDCWFVNSM